MSVSRTGGRSSRASASATSASAASKKKKAPVKKTTPKTSSPASRKSVAAPQLELEDDVTFKKVRSLALALPDTKLTMTWGSPHFRVGEKIFCGYGNDGGKQVLGVKLSLPHARAAVKEARFWPAPYVGKHGWVSLDIAQKKSWDEVAGLIRESYELIASKASLAKLR
jgi:predicted DNA-binding protein (MmcQ/YjbR family)